MFESFSQNLNAPRIKMNLISLISALHDNEAIINFALTYGYLSTPIQCDYCVDTDIGEFNNMKLQNYTRATDVKVYRCVRCKKTKGIRRRSIFANFNFPLMQSFVGIYSFLHLNIVGRLISRECEFKSLKTSNKFKKTLRKVMLRYYLTNSTRIGGYGVIIQVDETLVFKRKYNVGRRVEQVWIVGGWCKGQNRGFMMRVQRRNWTEIMEVLRMWCLPGTIFHTDSWAAYPRAIQNLDDSQHFTLNHSVEFVAEDGTHTQAYENLWGYLKNF